MTRRKLLKTAAGLSVCGGSPWIRALAEQAARSPKRRKSVILLWLDGGPSTIDLWDLKPNHANGGGFAEIETAVPGIRISQHLPNLAKQIRRMAIVRSMTSSEGDHGRATYFVRTGYKPVAGLEFPAVGAAIAHELDRTANPLPAFVSIAPARNAVSIGGGFLGPRFSPLRLAEHAETADGLTVPDLKRAEGISSETQHERNRMLKQLDQQFATGRDNSVIDAIQTASAGAIRMMAPQAATAFELKTEPASLRDSYGRGLFGQGCLLARRLIERGVPCVEVTLGGWDTHQENFNRVASLSARLDAAFATLLSDLKDRGLLESTVVACLGEFGRTPRINRNTGRDHWPRSWSAVLAGGIEGGQVIGATSTDGTEVVDRPVRVPDFIATISKSVGIDPMRQNMSNVGRPIRIADPAATPIKEI